MVDRIAALSDRVLSALVPSVRASAARCFYVCIGGIRTRCCRGYPTICYPGGPPCDGTERPIRP